MLLYSNRSTLRQIFQVHGAVIYRSDIVLSGLAIAGGCAWCQFLIDSDSNWAPEIPNNYGIHAMSTIVAFSTVFRTHLAWQRYWGAVSEVQIMYSKWGDAFTQFAVFAGYTIEMLRGSNGGTTALAKVASMEKRVARVHGHFQLLSALATDRLAHGDVERMNRRLHSADWKDRMTTRHALGCEERSGGRRLPEFKQASSEHTGKALEPDQDWTKEDGWNHTFLLKHPPSQQEIGILEDGKDRVSTVMTLITYDLTRMCKDCEIAPPIQSRMYQELSNGMVAYINSCKIADVPFPFPFAQMIIAMLMLFSCFIPLWVACFTKSMIAGPVLAFILFESVCSINEVAKDLENPFGNDPNDLPLYDFHMRFCHCIDETLAALEVSSHSGPVAKQAGKEA